MKAPAIPIQTPDVIRAGEVMAQLNDWRAITFVLVIVIVLLLVERFWTGWSVRRDRAAERIEMQNERERMWAVADKFTEAAKTVGTSMDKMTVEMTVLRLVSSRMEAGQGDRNG